MALQSAEIKAVIQPHRTSHLLFVVSICTLGLGVSVALFFFELTSPQGWRHAVAAAPNVTVDFTSTVRSVAPYPLSSTISTYGQDGGSIAVSASQRGRLGSLGLGLYRVPLQWNGGSIISSAGGGPTGISGDAWVSNIRSFGGVPMIVVGGSSDNNFSPSDAANLVQHFNANRATRVDFWVIGNEPGNAGMSIQAYCDLFNSTVDAMKAKDNTIKVIGPAWAYFDINALTTFLQCAGSRVDVIDYHHYAMGGTYLDNATALSQTGQWESEINQLRQSINQLVPNRASQIDIQVGEYNWSWQTADGYPGWNGDDRFYQAVATVWGASVAGHIMVAGGRGHQYADQNGALGLTFEKNSDAAHFGHQVTDPMPIFHGLRMLSGGSMFRGFGNTVVAASTSLSNTEVFASTNQKNIVLINKDPSATQNAAIQLNGVSGGTIDVWQTDQNAPFADPGKQASLTIVGGMVQLSLPPYSVSSLVVNEQGHAPPSSGASTPPPSSSVPPPSGGSETPAAPVAGSSSAPQASTATRPAANTPASNTTSSPSQLLVVGSGGAPTVSGTITLQAGGAGATVHYKIDSKPIIGNTVDTKKLSDGQHIVEATVRTPEGAISVKQQKIIVKNHPSSENAWLRPATYLLPVSLAVVSVGIAALTIWHHRRYRRPHAPKAALLQ